MDIQNVVEFIWLLSHVLSNRGLQIAGCDQQTVERIHVIQLVNYSERSRFCFRNRIRPPKSVCTEGGLARVREWMLNRRISVAATVSTESVTFKSIPRSL